MKRQDKNPADAFTVPKRAKILIVDDDRFYRKIYSDLIENLGHECITAINGSEAINKIQHHHPDIIISDVVMPGCDGFELIKKLKQGPATAHIPVLMITKLSDRKSRMVGLECGADEFLSKPVDEAEFCVRIKNMLKIKQYEDFLLENSRILEGEVVDKTLRLNEAFKKIKDGYMEIIYRLTRAAECRDTGTGKHIKRISLYSQLIATDLGLERSLIELVSFASPLHDIGKIGIPDYILLKPGSLTEDEYSMMKTHTTIGAGILKDSDSEILKAAEEIALTHHETWDGRGYPNGLKKDEIPLLGRIVKIVDIYDALRSHRPYLSPSDHTTACKIIVKQRIHFDPAVFNAFMNCSDKLKKLFDKNRD